MESKPYLEDPVETAPDDSPPHLNPLSRVKLNHPLDQVLGNVAEPMMTRRHMRNQVSQTFCSTAYVYPADLVLSIAFLDLIVLSVFFFT
ncbi:hypothetical protein U1Q18_023250, partial [Sarracenia purpurea var. burkii]